MIDGEKTIFRYENGSIQDKAHNNLLLFLCEPVNMRTYLLENEVTLDSRQLKKLRNNCVKEEALKEKRWW